MILQSATENYGSIREPITIEGTYHMSGLKKGMFYRCITQALLYITIPSIIISPFHLILSHEITPM
jgi:hypothetical protein